jgi:hypothetical protein
LANKAFRSARRLVGGLALLVAAVLALPGLTGCGVPAYTYVADSADSTYYKVPAGWHAISQSSLDQILSSGGGSTSGTWATAYDAGQSPSAQNILSFAVTSPFLFSEVIKLPQDVSNSLSYDELRDFLLPVTSDAQQEWAASGNTALSGFKQLRDDIITAANGVHGVRETFQYTFSGTSDTFDEVSLTNPDQTVVYFLMVHCTSTCYSQNEVGIDTVVQSFTVGSSS